MSLKKMLTLRVSAEQQLSKHRFSKRILTCWNAESTLWAIEKNSYWEKYDIILCFILFV